MNTSRRPEALENCSELCAVTAHGLPHDRVLAAPAAAASATPRGLRQQLLARGGFVLLGARAELGEDLAEVQGVLGGADVVGSLREAPESSSARRR